MRLLALFSHTQMCGSDHVRAPSLGPPCRRRLISFVCKVCCIGPGKWGVTYGRLHHVTRCGTEIATYIGLQRGRLVTWPATTLTHTKTKKKWNLSRRTSTERVEATSRCPIFFYSLNFFLTT
ncbi:hypothetical protein BS78_07G155800 [Paspalum vaginatum]|nr:hypothetical protein BS78_07G155800 [Paspalum vaginatum]